MDPSGCFCDLAYYGCTVSSDTEVKILWGKLGKRLSQTPSSCAFSPELHHETLRIHTKKLIHEKKLSINLLGGQNKFCLKIILGLKNFRSNKNLALKILGTKKFGVRKILNPKIFWFQKFLGSKHLLVQKIMGPKNFGYKNVWFKIILGSQM